MTTMPLRQRVPIVDASVLEDRTRPAPGAGRISLWLREGPEALTLRPDVLRERGRLGSEGQISR